MSRNVIGCWLIALLAWANLASADSVDLPASKSNSLIQVTSGTAQQLSNGQGDIYVGRTNQDGQGPATISIRRGLAAFDIADNVPAGATITGVSLVMDDVKGLNGNQTISLARMLRDWGQGTSFIEGGAGAPATNGDATWYYTFYNAANPLASPTWTAPGGLPGVDYSASASASSLVVAGSTNQTFVWSSTANSVMLTDVQRWLDSPGANFGWIVLGNETVGQTAQRFGGQSATAPESPPQLTVEYLTPWIWTGSAGNAAWMSSGNWTGGSGFPPAGAAIVLGDSRSTSGTVDLLSTAPSVSHLSFDANKSITITSTAPGGGQLKLDNGGNPVAIVVAGSGHSIDRKVAVTLDGDAWITTSGSNDSLSIAGNISSGTAAYGIVKDGPGTLILSGSDTYLDGTSVNEGRLILTNSAALPTGTSLTVGDAGAFGATFAPVVAGVSAAVPVPEPETLALVAAAECGASVFRCLRSRRRSGSRPKYVRLSSLTMKASQADHEYMVPEPDALGLYSSPARLTPRRTSAKMIAVPPRRSDVTAMLHDWFSAIEMPLTLPQFRQLPRNPAYKYEYIDGRAWLSPRPKNYHALLDLAAFACPIAEMETDDELAIRPLADADWPRLPRLFSAAFHRVQPFASLNDAGQLSAAEDCLRRTRHEDEGPLVAEACLVAARDKNSDLSAACLVTLPPDGDIAGLAGLPHLTWIFVSPDCARHGVGMALLDRAAQALLRQGYAQLASTFLLGNESSTLWHWRAGFKLLEGPWSMRRAAARR